jgi:tetratricopeptide (TPR) repeat protein
VPKTPGQWYTRAWELPEALDCHQRNPTVTAARGFPAVQAIALLGPGDYHYRTAAYAQALACYEQAEQATSLRSVGVMVGLVLANLSASMQRHERAESVCRAAIQAFVPRRAGTNLSLARFILGTILFSTGAWTDAIAAWQAGVIEDEARHDTLNLVQKLQSIAQAIVQQHLCL